MTKRLRIALTIGLLALAGLLAAADVSAPAPAALLPEYQALYDTATKGGDALVMRMNADVIALRAENKTLKAERDAALASVRRIRELLQSIP